jgi:hypothetical protein
MFFAKICPICANYLVREEPGLERDFWLIETEIKDAGRIATRWSCVQEPGLNGILSAM